MIETDRHEVYRGRTIRATSYERFDGTWRPHAVIEWSVDGQEYRQPIYWLEDEMLPTRAEADAKILELARAWVDRHA